MPPDAVRDLGWIVLEGVVCILKADFERAGFSTQHFIVVDVGAMGQKVARDVGCARDDLPCGYVYAVCEASGHVDFAGLKRWV